MKTWLYLAMLTMLSACGAGGGGGKDNASADSVCLAPCTDLLYVKTKLENPYKIKPGYAKIDVPGDCNDGHYPYHEIQWTLADVTNPNSFSSGLAKCDTGRFYVTVVNNPGNTGSPVFISTAKILTLKIIGKDANAPTAKTYENNATGTVSLKILVGP